MMHVQSCQKLNPSLQALPGLMYQKVDASELGLFTVIVSHR